MPNTHKPKKHGPPSKRPAPARPKQAPQRVPAGSTRDLATRVFHQLLDEKAAPESVVDGLRAAGLDPETIGELLRAVRGCIEFAEQLPADVDDFDADDVTDYLAEDLDIDPEVASDVVESFYALGEEA
jgi:hypothetical protein